MKRILYCVHRYAPYNGGSENYVKNLAEETLRQGHDVTVFAGEHLGDLHGVKVTNDPQCIFKKWDLIVVHGGDVGLQNYVLSHARKCISPILYLLILPSNSPVCVQALHDVHYIGCSTPADWRHVEYWNMSHKAVKIRHSIKDEESIGASGFRERYNITTPYMFLSCGGFWENKAFRDLVRLFEQSDRPDTTLVLTGYDDRNGLKAHLEGIPGVMPLMLNDRNEVLSALRETDLYIMHSTSEGFGLVLLESMWNYAPWAARHIAGAELLREYGFTYHTNEELIEYLKVYRGVTNQHVVQSHEFVKLAHLVPQSVNDILKVIS